MKRIFVVGSLNMDLVIESPRVPAAGETIRGRGFFTNAGGKGANQAAACAKLGGRVSMCGCVGKDGFGTTLVDGLSSYGADTAHIRVSSSATGVAVILLAEGDNRIVLDTGANGDVTAADVDRFLSEADAGDILLTQLEIPLPVVGYALRLGKARSMLTVLNPAPADTAVEAYLPYVDILLPNGTELAMLSGTDDIGEGMARLKARGVRQVAATLGARGCMFTDGDTLTEVPSFPVNAVDTTGAGDTFSGALAVRLAMGDALDAAIRYACAAAALAVTKIGAQQAVPTAAEVERFLSERA